MILRVSASIFGIVDQAAALHQFAPQEQVRGGIQIVGQRQRLVDRLDVLGAGVAGVVDLDLWPLIRIWPLVGLVGARQALDQRRLAGAVVAQKAHDLAGVKVDRDVVHRLDPAEGDRDVAQFDKRGAGSVTIDMQPLT
jgi:hypothetical protein